jgi:aquaporin Z
MRTYPFSDSLAADNPLTTGEAMRKHWPEYLMEAWGLGTFMVSAGLITTLLEYPNSPIRQAIEDADLRRMLIGLAMGLTAIAIIYSPWGKQCGAHLNPAVTLTFLRLGKMKAADALFYIIAQFLGGAVGVLLVWAVLGSAFADPPVDFVNTKPGAAGLLVAYLTEGGMAFGIMLMVLTALASGRLMRFIGLFAGLMVATYIAALAPFSGMSINPARSFASALPGYFWDYLWIYFTAPVLGMQLAVEVFRLGKLGREKFCAKLNHDEAYRCIHCGHVPARRAVQSRSVTSLARKR